MTTDTEPPELSPPIDRLIFGEPIEHPDQFVRQLTGVTA
jgi:hypothetical protein